ALTVIRQTTKTAAEVNAGRQRADSHNRSGNNSSTGITRSHQASGKTKMIAAIAAATAMSPTRPSMTSRRGAGTRTTDASPIINGATVMMPIASEENQCCQVTRKGTSGL